MRDDLTKIKKESLNLIDLMKIFDIKEVEIEPTTNKYQEALEIMKGQDCLAKEKAAEVLQELIDKFTPTKPVYIYLDEPICPYCREPLDFNCEICNICEQRIDWSE